MLTAIKQLEKILTRHRVSLRLVLNRAFPIYYVEYHYLDPTLSAEEKQKVTREMHRKAKNRALSQGAWLMKQPDSQKQVIQQFNRLLVPDLHHNAQGAGYYPILDHCCRVRVHLLDVVSYPELIAGLEKSYGVQVRKMLRQLSDKIKQLGMVFLRREILGVGVDDYDEDVRDLIQAKLDALLPQQPLGWISCEGSFYLDVFIGGHSAQAFEDHGIEVVELLKGGGYCRHMLYDETGEVITKSYYPSLMVDELAAFPQQILAHYRRRKLNLLL